MLKGKVAVITGGTRGIGNAIAQKYAENGANLAIIATKDNEKAQAAIEELKKNGTDVKLYLCDIKNADQVTSVSEEILADFGGVDIVVNNAGITRDNLLPGMSIADIPISRSSSPARTRSCPTARRARSCWPAPRS